MQREGLWLMSLADRRRTERWGRRASAGASQGRRPTLVSARGARSAPP